MSAHDHGLGRLIYPDDRDRNYPLQVAATVERRTVYWPMFHPALDQGREGTCFPGGTRVLMADGSHVPIEHVRLLDRVVTAEGGTGPVLQMMVRMWKGDLVRVKLWGHGHLQMTPEHPVLTKRGYVPAQELRGGDWVAVTRYRVEEEEERTTLDTGPLLAGVKTRARTEGMVNRGGVETIVATIPALIPLTPAFGKLVGLYLAEGSTSEQKVIWSFGKHERATLVEETVGLIREALGVEPRVQERPNNCTNVIIYNTLWVALFRRLLPGISSTKRLPSSLSCGPTAFREAILAGWLAGDGHARRGGEAGVTVSRDLALNMFTIANSLGLRPTIRRSEPSVNAHARSRRPRWDVAINRDGEDTHWAEQDDRALWRRVRGLEYKSFIGPVYNIHVGGAESYVAEGMGVHNCVGAAWRHWMLTAPVTQTKPDAEPRATTIYDEAIKVDEWPDNDNDTARQFGTSVRAGAQALRARGHLDTFGWAFDADTVIDWLCASGPIVLGTAWLESFSVPTAEGFLKVNPVTRVRGGHAYLANGVSLKRGAVRCTNSWGPTWNQRGRFWLSFEDLDWLIRREGEACSALEIGKVRA